MEKLREEIIATGLHERTTEEIITAVKNKDYKSVEISGNEVILTVRE